MNPENKKRARELAKTLTKQGDRNPVLSDTIRRLKGQRDLMEQTVVDLNAKAERRYAGVKSTTPVSCELIGLALGEAAVILGEYLDLLPAEPPHQGARGPITHDSKAEDSKAAPQGAK